MEKATVLSLLFSLIVATGAAGQALTFSCGNPTTDPGSLTFDVLVTPDASAVGDSLGDMQVYLDYSTAALGTNIAGASSYVVGDDMNTLTTGTYSTNTINNNTSSRISADLSFEDTRQGVPPFTPPIFPVELQSGVHVRIMRITVPVIDSGEMTGLAFNIGLMDGQQFYEPPPPAAPIALFTVSPGSSCDIDAQLPVELSSFSATPSGRDVFLSWTTESETGNHGFELQQTSDGLDQWKSVTFVPTRGTSGQAASYSLRVDNLSPGVHSFRLKQIDIGGRSTYSHEVEAVVELGTTFEMHSWPNPFTDQSSVSIAVSESQHVRIDVFDAVGRQVATVLDAPIEANSPRTVLWRPHGLSSGLYHYRILGERFSGSKTVILTR